MKIIKTKSFELATTIKGDQHVEKIAILCPGRLDTKDYQNFQTHSDYLATKGYLAIAFDPPGTWESPGGIELFTTTNYIKAVNELIEYFGNKPTLLLGHSRGAAVSLLVAKENPKVIGVIALMPALGAPTPPDEESIQRGFKVSQRDLPPGTTKTKEQKTFNLPIAYFTDGEQYDPATAVQHLDKPKMVLYANDDKFMTPEEAEEILGKVPAPKMTRELNCTHDYRYFPEVIQEVNKLIGQFLEKYLS